MNFGEFAAFATRMLIESAVHTLARCAAGRDGKDVGTIAGGERLKAHKLAEDGESHMPEQLRRFARGISCRFPCRMAVFRERYTMGEKAMQAEWRSTAATA